MTDKQIINAQQRALTRSDRALSEARGIIVRALNDLRQGGTIAAHAKLENYAREVMKND